MINGIAVLPSGLELEGANELIALGANSVKPLRGTVSFEADQACFYRLHLQARLPFRLLREMARFPCHSPETLYRGIQRALPWDRWLDPSTSFRVDVSGSSVGLTHSHFSALQVKNALVDLQREIWGERSNVNLRQPDFCVHVHLNHQGAVLSLAGSASSLHKRGYRSAMGSAPLKENLAAGLIRISGWDQKTPLVDPLCGSGTFLIEAASMALGLVPRLKRSFLFEAWPDFDPVIWDKEKTSSKAGQYLQKNLPMIVGCEQDNKIAEQARANISLAGLDRFIRIQNSNFQELSLPNQKGILLCNPPYGKRLGNNMDLGKLYEELGQFTKKKASGWSFWLLSGNPNLTKFLRLKANRRVPITNGGIDCRWLNYLIN